MSENKQLVELILEATKFFLLNKGNESNPSIYKSGELTFIGVQKSAQSDLRQFIRTVLKTEDNVPIVQFVGNCARYTQKGTLRAKELILEYLKNRKVIIEWGLTGYDNKNEEAYDINYLVGLIVDLNNIPSIANIVDFHTIKALTDWGCSCSKTNKYFVLVYDDKGGKALFGDDTVTSDSSCDELFCIDGGLQSFEQWTRCLLLNKPIYGLYGARTRENSFYFNTTLFFKCLTDKLNKKNMSSDEIKAYFEGWTERGHLYVESKGDACTKQALLDNAFKMFFDHQLWEKLPKLCKFIDISV